MDNVSLEILIKEQNQTLIRLSLVVKELQDKIELLTREHNAMVEILVDHTETNTNQNLSISRITETLKLQQIKIKIFSGEDPTDLEKPPVN